MLRPVFGAVLALALALTAGFAVVVAVGYDAPSTGDKAAGILLGSVPGLLLSGGLALLSRTRVLSRDMRRFLAELVLLTLAVFLYMVGGYAIAGDG